MRGLSGYAVVIDPDGVAPYPEKDYEDLVELHIGEIYSTVVGRAIFAIIRAHGRVLIQPYTGDEQCQGQSVGGYNPAGYGTLGRFTPSYNNYQVVQYSPQFYAKGYPTPCAKRLGWDGNELLCHEIFHAARRLGGDPSRFDGLDGDMAGWDNEEEFFAILVANIYSSETNRPDHLRADHGTASLMGSRRQPEVWLQQKEAHYDLVEKFCSQHTTAAPIMAKSSAPFNPIRTYYEWKSRNYKPKKWGQLAPT
jgi:hypothetical protein